MIKYTLLGVTALFLISCTQVNTSAEKTITQGGDTIGEMDISLSKMDAVEELSKIDEQEATKLLFKASGSEPGWLAEFYNTKLRLVVDYGKDSLIMDSKFENLDRQEGFLMEMKNDVNTQKHSIQIINKPCTSTSGDKADRQVVVTYKGKKYTGCGNFVK